MFSEARLQEKTTEYRGSMPTDRHVPARHTQTSTSLDSRAVRLTLACRGLYSFLTPARAREMAPPLFFDTVLVASTTGVLVTVDMIAGWWWLRSSVKSPVRHSRQSVESRQRGESHTHHTHTRTRTHTRYHNGWTDSRSVRNKWAINTPRDARGGREEPAPTLHTTQHTPLNFGVHERVSTRTFQGERKLRAGRGATTDGPDGRLAASGQVEPRGRSVGAASDRGGSPQKEPALTAVVVESTHFCLLASSFAPNKGRKRVKTKD